VKTDIKGQTDKQTDKQVDKQTDKQTDTQTPKEEHSKNMRGKIIEEYSKLKNYCFNEKLLNSCIF
jgi:hypothetical protein